jgi:hypothetical protein
MLRSTLNEPLKTRECLCLRRPQCVYPSVAFCARPADADRRRLQVRRDERCEIPLPQRLLDQFPTGYELGEDDLLPEDVATL